MNKKESAKSCGSCFLVGLVSHTFSWVRALVGGLLVGWIFFSHESIFFSCVESFFFWVKYFFCGPRFFLMGQDFFSWAGFFFSSVEIFSLG